MDGPARVAAALRERQLQARIERFPAGTATSPDAPAAGRYEGGQIVKTRILLAQGWPTGVRRAAITQDSR